MIDRSIAADPRGISRRHGPFPEPARDRHTVPYGTAFLGGAVPGTSCQATFAPSLRDEGSSLMGSRFLKHLTCPQFRTSAISHLGLKLGPCWSSILGCAAELLGAACRCLFSRNDRFTSDGQSSITRTGTGTNTIDGLADMIRNDGIDAKKSLLT